MAYAAVTGFIKNGTIEDHRSPADMARAYLWMNHRDIWRDNPGGLIDDLASIIEAGNAQGADCEDLMKKFDASVERYRASQTAGSSESYNVYAAKPFRGRRLRRKLFKTPSDIEGECRSL